LREGARPGLKRFFICVLQGAPLPRLGSERHKQHELTDQISGYCPKAL